LPLCHRISRSQYVDSWRSRQYECCKAPTVASASEAADAFARRADGSFLVEGSASIEEVVNRLELEPLPEEEAGAYHTLGGFVMARLGRVPKVADTFDWEGMRFEVVDMDGRRIDKVLISRKEDGESSSA